MRVVLIVPQFGQIVRYVGIGYHVDLTKPALLSARVMRNELGDSRGFGFVSFQTPDQGPVASTFLKST